MNGILGEPIRLLATVALGVYLAISFNRFVSFMLRKFIIKKNRGLLLGKQHQVTPSPIKPLGFIENSEHPKFCKHCAKMVTDYYEFPDGSIKCKEGYE